MVANYKRKKPKRYLFIDCCRMEAGYDSGNHRFRAPIKDLKKSQMNTHDKAPWRYKNVIGY